MTKLTGRFAGIMIKVEDGTTWENLELAMCVIVAGPQTRFKRFYDVTFVNCIFLYDGMEVDGREWLQFVSMPKRGKKAKPTHKS